MQGKFVHVYAPSVLLHALAEAHYTHMYTLNRVLLLSQYVINDN